MQFLPIKDIVKQRLGENYTLHERYLNRTLVQVQRMIGFDKVYARAEGQYLYDQEGNRYLDFLSGFGVYNIGRNHPIAKQAIRDILDLDLPNMVQMDSALLSGLLAEALVKRLAQQGAPHLNAVFLCNSGTESVEGALKFARCATGRPRIVSLKNSYHGLTYGSLSVTANPFFHEGFGPFLPDITHVPLGDLEALERELKKGDVAAFILELIQGKGVYYAPDEYYPAAQALCRKYGALLICDEVQTGLGRTGKWFAFEHWKLEPDIITLAKTLSAGYVPAAAIITRRSIYQKVYSRLDRCIVHSTSFGRNNLACVCGLAALHIIEKEQLHDRAAQLGQLLEAELKKLTTRHEIISQVRVKGLMAAIEFAEPNSLGLKMGWKAIHALDPSLFPQLIVTPLLQKHRILTQVAANKLDCVKILPPLVCTEADIHYFIGALDSVLSDLRKFPGPIWDMGQNFFKAMRASTPKEQEEDALYAAL
ncbi:MAG: aspartate aminotransferase family protein [Methylacidiphilales bacterium]|nr:aspartate aminotransferase family protein [Candidatus Methylacidiphilales bacterium]MDW8350089.1 aspartate aminotransferase family protein [Verrucomicrobiae bacterium]